MLQEYMIENEALRTENSEMHSNKDKVKREQQNLYKENERLLRRIEDLQREKYDFNDLTKHLGLVVGWSKMHIHWSLHLSFDT